MTSILQIPLNKIVESKTNPRSSFDKTALAELAASIAQHGIIEPLVVRGTPDFQTTGMYEIVAGARRFRAAPIAKLTEVPAIVRSLVDSDVLVVQQIENLQREDISALDEARGYQQLVAAGLKVEDVAKEVGKGKSHVYGRLAMLRCIPAVLKAVENGEITVSHAVELAPLTAKQQTEMIEDCLDYAWSVKSLQQQIERTQYKVLHSGPWKKDDAKLLPKVGPCTTCPKNTDVNKDLRAAVHKPGICTDAGCFQAKLNAYIDREKLQRLSRYYDSSSGSGKNTLGTCDWKAAKVKAPGSQKGIIVEGGKDVGAVVTFKRIRHSTTKSIASYEARNTKRRANALREKHYRQAVFSELQKKVPKKFGRPELEMIEREVSPSNKLKGTIEQRILLGCVEQDVRVTEYWTPKAGDLFALAKRSKVDVRRIRKELRAAEEKKPAAKGGKK
jgi:ParB/RepB/Spo0J family partition protein